MVCAIGYATSTDGVHWAKYQGDPVLQAMNDPYLTHIGDKSGVENPSILFLDSICYMYYDFPNLEGGIGVATALSVGGPAKAGSPQIVPYPGMISGRQDP
jgi:hypothetical protein